MHHFRWIRALTRRVADKIKAQVATLTLAQALGGGTSAVKRVQGAVDRFLGEASGSGGETGVVIRRVLKD